MTVCYTLSNGIEVIDDTEYAFDRLQAMKTAEKMAEKTIIKRNINRKRKKKIEEIKAAIVLGLAFYGLLFGMFAHWLLIGY